LKFLRRPLNLVNVVNGCPLLKLRMGKKKKRRKNLKKTAIVLCVPKIVATTQIHALVADSTSVQPTELRTEVFAPTDCIGMTKKSKTYFI